MRRLRRAKLRTRVLAGVLAVTLAALAAFDIAAAAALRGYLLGRVDEQLQAVLRLYTVQQLYCGSRLPVRCGRAFAPAMPPVGPAAAPSNVHAQREIASRIVWTGSPPRHVKAVVGPVLSLPGILGQYYVGIASASGRKVFIRTSPGLVPAALPANLDALARSHKGATVASLSGNGPVRLMAETFPRYGVVYVTTGLGEVDRTVGQLELILLIGSAAAGLAAAGGVAWVMRRGLRPVEVMAAQADRINAGDLTDRVTPADGRTEVGRLGTAINGMLARIHDFIAEREASQEATRRFFADASHELRTPLASLRANAELCQQGALPRRDQVDEAMRRIALEARRMGGLVDDMLRLARLDQQPAQQREPVDVSALVTECAQRARTADPQRNWRVSAAADLEVAADEELLRRAIDNLLANVTAHTPEGSTAAITAARHGGCVTVEVRDDGPGVPSSQLPRIFERFYRTGSPSGRPGSGLGLAIVAAVAGAHGGSACAADGEPHGLSITLTLPADLVPSPQDGQRPPERPAAGTAHDLAAAGTP